MAKAKSLLEIAKAAKIQRSGAKEWRDGLAPQDRIEFDEFIAWMREGIPGETRPTKKQAMELVRETFKRNITQHTFDKYYSDAK